MADSSASSYIHTVQHLIEECIIFKMSKEDCMEALSKHANILPLITSTVWNELEKENKEFFEAYKNKVHSHAVGTQQQREDEEEETRQRIHNLLLASAPKDAIPR